jgi:hypothetical protein
MGTMWLMDNAVNIVRTQGWVGVMLPVECRLSTVQIMLILHAAVTRAHRAVIAHTGSPLHIARRED